MQMFHWSGVDTFAISRFTRKCPISKRQFVLDRCFTNVPAMKKCWACILPRAFDVMIRTISCLHVDFECFKLALWPTLRQKLWTFEAFWLVQAINMMNRSAIALRLPKLVQAHDSAVTLRRVSRFLRSYKTSCTSTREKGVRCSRLRGITGMIYLIQKRQSKRVISISYLLQTSMY